jgi:nucleotide-binding universal stress UspA family protein
MRVLVVLDGHIDDALARASAYLCEASRDSAVLFAVVDPHEARETVSGRSDAQHAVATQTGTLLSSGGGAPRAAEARDQAVQRVLDARRVELDALARRYFQHVPVETKVEISGDPADVILGAARAIGASGIAVGAQKQSSLAAAILGSVASDLLRRSPVPVLVIREDMATATAAPDA